MYICLLNSQDCVAKQRKYDGICSCRCGCVRVYDIPVENNNFCSVRADKQRDRHCIHEKYQHKYIHTKNVLNVF